MSGASSAGLRRLLANIIAIEKALPKAIDAGLARLGERAVMRLKATAYAGDYGSALDGHPHLVDKGVYINGFVPLVKKGSLDIDATGQNRHMSNHDLAGILEYHYPHLRPLGVWIETYGSQIVGNEVERVLRLSGSL